MIVVNDFSNLNNIAASIFKIQKLHNYGISFHFCFVQTCFPYLHTYIAQVIQAYASRVNLSAQGFYKIPDVSMDWETGTGNPYPYYTYGVGCSVVEVDTLTGSFQVKYILYLM